MAAMSKPMHSNTAAASPASGLSHLDEHGRPRMVDVGDKSVTRRVAMAQAWVRFPEAVFAQLRQQQFRGGKSGAKGAIIDTAVIAGTMAGKRTHELIPFCHPLPVERIGIGIEALADQPVLAIRCEVAVSGRTGVEMEALTGASVAALTVYDMCKALSHDIRIESLRLLAKSGGRHDYQAKEDDDGR